jgi:hypothetical protein
MLRGLRAEPSAPDALPVPPPSREQIDELLAAGALVRR